MTRSKPRTSFGSGFMESDATPFTRRLALFLFPFAPFSGQTKGSCPKLGTIGVLFGCFGRKIDGFRFPFYLVVQSSTREIRLFPLKGRICWVPSEKRHEQISPLWPNEGRRASSQLWHSFSLRTNAHTFGSPGTRHTHFLRDLGQMLQETPDFGGDLASFPLNFLLVSTSLAGEKRIIYREALCGNAGTDRPLLDQAVARLRSLEGEAPLERGRTLDVLALWAVFVAKDGVVYLFTCYCYMYLCCMYLFIHLLAHLRIYLFVCYYC